MKNIFKSAAAGLGLLLAEGLAPANDTAAQSLPKEEPMTTEACQNVRSYYVNFDERKYNGYTKDELKHELTYLSNWKPLAKLAEEDYTKLKQRYDCDLVLIRAQLAKLTPQP